MLKSYEAVYKHGKLDWLNIPPQVRDGMKVIVVIEESDEQKYEIRRKELMKTLKATWGCVTPRRSIVEIDKDIRKMRDEWEREWDKK